MAEPAYKAFSPIILLAAAVTQGGMGVAAMGFIAKEQERSFEELNQPLPEHASLIQKSEEADRAKERYKEKTQWYKMKCPQKFFLIAAVVVESMASWAVVAMGSKCFRKFEMGNSIDDPLPDGLDGKTSNLLVSPGGHAAMGLMWLGVLLFCIYLLCNKVMLEKDPPQEKADPPQEKIQIESESKKEIDKE